MLFLVMGCGHSEYPDRMDRNTLPSELELEREEEVSPRWQSIDPDPYDSDPDPVM